MVLRVWNVMRVQPSFNSKMSVAEKICIFVLLLRGVYCGEFSISLPEKIEALSGSCVIINCTFETNQLFGKALTEGSATVLWLKDGSDINKHQVFNSRDPKPNYFEGEMTGKLHEKNCTTVFYNVSSNYNGKYYFRIMTSEGKKYTYHVNFSINVIESPHKPTVQLSAEQKEVQDQEEVLEGSSVSLRCSAETLCSSPPPALTWSSTPRIPLSESSRLQELILISELNFTATHHQHGVTFTCTITYQLQDENKTAQNNITLHVQYSPKNTSVSVSPVGSVLKGSSVTLTCSSDANPAVLNYTWSREIEGQLKQMQTGDTLTFNRTDLKHRGWYHCTAQNQHGSQNSSVMLDIQYAPKISSSSSCTRTDVTVCFCEADGNPCPELEWHLSGRPVINSSNTFISEERLSSTGLRSSITLHQSLTNTSTLQCISKNTHGTARKLLQLPPFHVQFADCQQTTVSLLIILALILVLYALTVGLGLYKMRQLSTKLKAQNEAAGTYASLQLSAPVTEYETLNIKRGCPHKPTVQLYVEQDQEEVMEGSSVSLRCSAESLCSSPPPTLTWSSTPRIPLSDSSRLQELILISDLNFTATHHQHGVTFTCTITYQLQDKNKTAQDSITLHVQYSPKNTSVSVFPSSSVLEGSSVTLTCSSDANSAVVSYTWSRESEGQLKQLQTGDTLTFNRTNLKHRGWYHCTAQNQHGSHNSSVMLDIQYSPKNTSVSVFPSSSVMEGSSVTLTCSSDANPAVLSYT
ncbi:hypothetical protein QQF64_035532 [Cirrhinus molitorella]|uniref:Ig-like domain-containing protein n=1 Tax=Cirrhinus molitorella TaxID=172907 RepID=A0ABR3NG27_9TELE